MDCFIAPAIRQVSEAHSPAFMQLGPVFDADAGFRDARRSAFDIDQELLFSCET
jgi:hypothetical protein